jgi:shikimate kinase
VNLALIGLRASGKTTIGRVVAQRLGRVFIDLDDATLLELVGRASRPPSLPTIADAWRTFGEPAFRAAEVRALRRILDDDHQIIALGGGTPTAPGATELINQHRAAQRLRIIYLRATSATLAARFSATGATPDRPSLTGAGVIEEIPHVFAQRDPLYRALADDVVEVDAMSPEDVGLRILTIAAR